MTNIFIGLKKTCLGVLDRGERDNANATGLKEGGVIKIETTVLSITRCTLSSLCIYLPSLSFSIFVEGDERIVVFIFVLLVLLGGDKSGNLLSTFFNNR